MQRCRGTEITGQIRRDYRADIPSIFEDIRCVRIRKNGLVVLYRGEKAAMEGILTYKECSASDDFLSLLSSHFDNLLFTYPDFSA